ncbi:hypothetical protein WJX73_010110 [Symbiochloris irregularis]|uniref:2-oxoadipate dioxygenase/decarboxylase n=1 Tax=Symbiochloris irregularis TaxID=706552 RepID=A0AAW1NQF7_9CHLO
MRSVNNSNYLATTFMQSAVNSASGARTAAASRTLQGWCNCSAVVHRGASEQAARPAACPCARQSNLLAAQQDVRQPGRGRAVISCGLAQAADSTASKACKGGPLLDRFVSLLLDRYWASTPTAVSAMGLLQALDRSESSPLYFDHIAFRSFGVEGFGIKSIATIFVEFGFQQRDELQFPGKKLRALWFAPPHDRPDLPRIFISEIKVEELSEAAQRVIRKYTQEAGSGKYAPLCAVGSVLPWSNPTLADFELLAKESEYAAWTLINGYALNHATVAVHRMRGLSDGIAGLVEDLRQQGFDLNEEGGTLKVSPDNLLVQAATQADQVDFTFRDGEQGTVPGSYIEFAQRKRLPQYNELPDAQVSDAHLRDGFEASNADKIFHSTNMRAEAVPAAR